MNSPLTKLIISRLENEVCPVHGKKADVVNNKGVLTFENVCCSEFRQHLTEQYIELIKTAEPHPLLKQMLGLK